MDQERPKKVLGGASLRLQEADGDGRGVDPNRYQSPVSVVIPAYNEDAAVGSQVERINRILTAQRMTYEILVVDDGSEDLTAERALQAGACVLRHPENRGYGAALKTGILAAKYDAIVITDADGTYPAEEIPKLVAQLETADMVVGARTGEEVHIPLIRRPAKLLLGWLAARVAGRSIPDLNSGLRAFRRQCAEQYFSILSNRFSFTTTITMAFLGDDYRVIYHPINYYRRVGKSKITPGNFMDFIILVLRMAMLFNPLRVFLPLALACGLLGVLKAAFDIVSLFLRPPVLAWSLFFQPVLSSSAILLMLVALQLLLIGMVADGLLRRISRQERPRIPSHGVLLPLPRLSQRAEKADMVVDVK